MNIAEMLELGEAVMAKAQAEIERLRTVNVDLIAVINDALDAIDKYPERKHPLTASEIRLREAVIRAGGR